MPVFCGLCKQEITGSWEEHIAGEEHQASLRDEEKIRKVKLEHLKATERGIRGDRNDYR